MKKITKGLLLTALILIFLIIVLNIIYTEIILKNMLLYRGDVDRKEYLQRNELKDAFFGDSHTKYAVHPKYLDNHTYNFAIGSESYFYSYYLLKGLIEENDTPSRIFLQIDTNSFSDALAKDTLLINDVWYWEDYMTYEEMGEITTVSKVVLRIYAKIPYIGKGTEIIKFFTSKDRTDTYRGWANYTHVATQREKEAGGRLLYERDFANGPYHNGTMLRYFTKILELANASNISVVLVRYPVAPEYYTLLEENNIIDPYYEKIIAIANETGPYRMLDFHDVFFTHPEYFNDIDHLNYNGSIAFSQLLQEKIRSTHE